MDLMGFTKDLGRRLFNVDEKAAEEIKKAIEAGAPGVKNLEVTFDRGNVGLKGECDTAATLQQCVLMAGNVKGVSDVYAGKLTVAAIPKAAKVSEPEPEERVEFYEIKSGDTLGKLAKKYYGNASKYPRIFEANRGVIEDPNKIFVGQKIRIPLD